MIFYHRNICPTGYFFIWLFVSGYFWISVYLEVQSYDLALNLKPWFNISFESVVIVQEGQDQRFNQNSFVDQSYQILKRNMLQSHLSYSIENVQQITTQKHSMMGLIPEIFKMLLFQPILSFVRENLITEIIIRMNFLIFTRVVLFIGHICTFLCNQPVEPTGKNNRSYRGKF